MQKTVTKQRFSRMWQLICPYLLLIFWCSGMLLGCLMGQRDQGLFVDLIRQAAGITPSFIGSCCAALLPVMLSCFVVSICEPWLLLVISTFKAFSFSLCAWGVCLAFGQSSWLVLFLFLFSDICIVPAMYFYWLRHIRNCRNSNRSAAILMLYALLIGLLDYFFVAPFLASILN